MSSIVNINRMPTGPRPGRAQSGTTTRVSSDSASPLGTYATRRCSSDRPLDRVPRLFDKAPMRYEDFRAAFEDALRESKLKTIGLWADETLNLRSLRRSYEVGVLPFGGQDTDPFHVAGKLSFRWDALQTARTNTMDEDVLTELLGRERAFDVETEKALLRVDVELRANLPWGKPMPMPSKAAWAAWVREVMGRLENIEPLTSKEKARLNEEGHLLEVLAWQDEPKAKVVCIDTGALLLESVSMSALQTIETPRILDDPEHFDEPPYEQLGEMFSRVRASMSAWMQALDNLKRLAKPKLDS